MKPDFTAHPSAKLSCIADNSDECLFVCLFVLCWGLFMFPVVILRKRIHDQKTLT